MKNEADVKKLVKKVLDALPLSWYFMPVPTGFGVQGVPDFVVCWDGRFIGIETKFGKNTTSKWQDIQRAGITAACGVYLIINEKNVNELRDILEEAYARYPEQTEAGPQYEPC